jgi:hypothetical protein
MSRNVRKGWTQKTNWRDVKRRQKFYENSWWNKEEKTRWVRVASILFKTDSFIFIQTSLGKGNQCVVHLHWCIRYSDGCQYEKVTSELNISLMKPNEMYKIWNTRFAWFTGPVEMVMPQSITDPLYSGNPTQWTTYVARSTYRLYPNSFLTKQNCRCPTGKPSTEHHSQSLSSIPVPLPKIHLTLSYCNLHGVSDACLLTVFPIIIFMSSLSPLS